MYRSVTRAALRLATLCLALAATGCIREPDPFTVDTDDVAVHMILEAGADSVSAMVERPGDPIEDATVRLIAGADTTILSYSTPSCMPGYLGPDTPEGCHRARLAQPIQAGAVYGLEVVLPGGARVTGTTTVPLTLTLVSPTEGEQVVADCDMAGPDQSGDPCYGGHSEEPPYNIPVATVVFRWVETADPQRIGADVNAVRTFLDGVEYGGEEGCRLGSQFLLPAAVAADSLVWPIPNIGCNAEPLRQARFDSIHATARVYVWNQQMEDYSEALGSRTVRATDVSVGLEGAWGLFGAMAPSEVTITIVRDPPI